MQLDPTFSAIAEVSTAGRALRVMGDVDVTTASRFEVVLAAACAAESDRDGSVTIDFTGCRYLDSSGLSVLIRARRAYGDRLSLVVRAQTPISRLLRLTSLDTVFAVSLASA